MFKKREKKFQNLTKKNNISIKVSNLFFKYHEKHPYILDDLNFEIKHGEYVTIIGHNGSGKSTLSKILIGVLFPEKGEIEIFGNKVTKTNISEIRKYLGIVFQNPDNQFIGTTVADDIAFGLENRKVPNSLMKDIIQNSARRVGMEAFLDHEPLMLSGGQKQRVAIASALALSADILVFDESTSMLDPLGKSEVKDIMIQLKNEGKTIISITHDMDEILNADKVIVLNNGKLVKCGSFKEILKDKEFLKEIKLDIPFISNLINSLNSKLEKKIFNIFDEDELVKILSNKIIAKKNKIKNDNI